MTNKVPFVSSPRIRAVAKKFIGIGDLLTHTSPYIALHLRQSGLKEEYKINAREYLSLCFIVSAFYATTVSIILTLLFKYLEGNPLIGFGIGVAIGLLMYVYLLIYPKYIVSQRVKKIEKNLLFALRNVLIELRSGIPIFDALVSVSMRDFGPISDEIKIVVDRVSSGTNIIKALEELAVRNPSQYFRRALWQIVNSMKAGSDLSDNLSDVVKTLSKEQLIEVGEYKSKLNPLSMMYMMIAVIMPSMGITILLVVSSLPGMGELANERMLWMLLASTSLLQVIFLAIIKAQRPNLLET